MTYLIFTIIVKYFGSIAMKNLSGSDPFLRKTFHVALVPRFLIGYNCHSLTKVRGELFFPLYEQVNTRQPVL